MKQLAKEYIQNVYNTCKDKQEFIDLLDIQYEHKSGTALNIEILNHLHMINPNVSKSDITAKAFRDRYKERLISEYNNNPNICVICGNNVPYDRKDTYTCCKKCCHIKANKERGPRSIETKEKISTSVLHSIHKIHTSSKFKQISECISLGILENYNNVNYTDRYININRCKEHICPICGKIYHTYLANNGNLTDYSACSQECLKIKSSNKIKEKIEERKANGVFKGWQSRNITSYPERFWKQVLDNNNILYKFNYHFDKYFLDFYIEIDNRKIDLEIDGKQHKYQERLESDKIRDEFVKSQNIEIYRIDWNEINSDEGKNTMKNKIDKFLEYIKDR